VPCSLKAMRQCAGVASAHNVVFGLRCVSLGAWGSIDGRGASETSTLWSRAPQEACLREREPATKVSSWTRNRERRGCREGCSRSLWRVQYVLVGCLWEGAWDLVVSSRGWVCARTRADGAPAQGPRSLGWLACALPGTRTSDGVDHSARRNLWGGKNKEPEGNLGLQGCREGCHVALTLVRFLRESWNKRQGF
jgi:hypothetical protein